MNGPLSFAFAILLTSDWFPNGLTTVDTGMTVTRAATCGICHAQQYEQWSVSRHALSWTNAIFQREYKDKPLDWCVHCHAPLPEQHQEIQAGGGTLANEGITCVTCHIRDGRMQSNAHAQTSPHDTVVDPSFGSPRFCGGCHQFNFPAPERIAGSNVVRRYTSEPMQDTQHQHATGPRTSQGCLSCHGGDLGHRFPGGHNAKFLSRALSVAACRDHGRLQIGLANVGAGHNVPTGDVHRHLVLRVWPVDAPEKLQEVIMGRRFAGDEVGAKHLLSDTSIPAGKTRIARFDWPQRASTSLRMELRLVYTIDEFPFRGRELAEPTSMLMAEDELSWSKLQDCKRARSQENK